MSTTGKGPLAGIKILELAGLGPVPLAGLVLAELGATVLRIERIDPGKPIMDMPPEFEVDRHGREIIRLDLKSETGKASLMALIKGADVLIEGFRPGVMERLGAGPQEALAINPRLVYGRMTGWGQDGPLANSAGHDLTYLATTGILDAIGPAGGKPVPPLNLIADFGGGMMVLIAGVLAALLERANSGKGQVVDAAMTDGASMLAIPFFAWIANDLWRTRRGSNLLDSGAPFYDTYETADGKYMAIASVEPQFFAALCDLLPLPQEFRAVQNDRRSWPAIREAIAARFRQRTREEWTAHFAGSDACVQPVLSFEEAPCYPHHQARNAYSQRDGFLRPEPAPRFSRTPATRLGMAEPVSLRTLERFGLDQEAMDMLRKSGVQV